MTDRGPHAADEDPWLGPTDLEPDDGSLDDLFLADDAQFDTLIGRLRQILGEDRDRSTEW